MFTIRFPNGQAIQYNDAHYAERKEWGYTDIYTAKDGTWLAQIPTAGCVLEVRPPCNVYNPLAATGLKNALATVIAEVRNLRRDQIRSLKRALKGYDARSGEWKESK